MDMTRADDIGSIVSAAHALTRLAAVQTRNDAPAAQWRALSVLTSDGPLRLGELATASRTTQPGMTKLVGQMIDEGLVTRTNDPSDSRVVIIDATKAGRDALAAWRVELSDALEPMFHGLDDDDWAVLNRAARILESRTRTPLEAAR
jgi:DNA-binding MarR family transcriptional regulator